MPRTTPTSSYVYSRRALPISETHCTTYNNILTCPTTSDHASVSILVLTYATSYLISYRKCSNHSIMYNLNLRNASTVEWLFKFKIKLKLRKVIYAPCRIHWLPSAAKYTNFYTWITWTLPIGSPGATLPKSTRHGWIRNFSKPVQALMTHSSAHVRHTAHTRRLTCWAAASAMIPACYST